MAIQNAELNTAVPASSPRRDFWRLFRRNRMALVGLVMLLAIIVTAVFAPILSPYDPKSSENVSIGDVYNPPSAQHWFGTDDAGRDVLSSFMYGARVSLIVGFFASFISVIMGGVIGLVAGFYGGRIENVLMR